MCVTSGQASMTGTRTYVYATSNDEGASVHVCGYQNQATNLSHRPNCMFLNFAGTNLELVSGPEHTRTLMNEMTAGLKELIPVPKGRDVLSFGSYGFRVENYGDYTVVLAQQAGAWLDALAQVRPDRRPRPEDVEPYAALYDREFPGHEFVLACFDGKIKPKHPIVVQYQPNDPDVLTIPGLDGHDGRLPRVGAPVQRDFKVAFATHDMHGGESVYYGDDQAKHAWWAPRQVVGFVDNRQKGKNGDYVVPTQQVAEGVTGRKLADCLQ